jgi:hypothetical protein
MLLASCSTRQPAQSRAFTRQDLVAMKSEDDKLADRLAAERDPWDAASWTHDSRSHYYYMGTKDGYDHVAKLWGNSRGGQGYPGVLLRVGELRIDRRHELTHDFSKWQEIDLTKQ